MTANPTLLTAAPNSAELEQAILGGILSDTNAISTALQVFGDANPFYLETPRKVYAACVQMYNTFRPIDLLTVSEELRKRGELDKVGGTYQLIEYTNRYELAFGIYDVKVGLLLAVRTILISRYVHNQRKFTHC